MEADQQAFELRPEKNQFQMLSTRDGLGITTGSTVLIEPVGIEKDQRSHITCLGDVTPSPSVDGVFHDPSRIASTGDGDIEMKVQTSVVTQTLQPLQKGAVSFAFRSHENALASWNRPITRHCSAESRQPAERAATVQFAKATAPTHTLDIANSIRIGHAFPALLDDEHLLLLQFVEN